MNKTENISIEKVSIEKVTIEKVTIADTDELLAIYAPYVENTAITFEYDVPSHDEFEGRIRDISSRLPYIKAVDASGQILGYAYAGTFKGRKAYDWSVETTIYLRQDSQGLGLGRKLYDTLEEMLRSMGITNMNACITMPRADDPEHNTRSRDFHSHMGFEMVGTFHYSGYKFNRWYDMIWMEKMIASHDQDMPPVRFGSY